MQKIVATCMLMVASTFATASHAQDIRVWIYGNGSDSCGRWSANQRTAPHGVDATIELSWVLGYLTGSQALEQARVGFHFRHPDPDAVAGWLDNFCRRHPLTSLINATVALDRTLKLP